MKTLLSVILTAGTAYYVTSRVAITGPSDWGAVPPSAPHRNGDATATFTLTSTGESDLEGVSLAASTYAGIGTATITANSCGEVVPSGKSCNVVVAFSLPKEGAAAHGYVLLQAIGNTRQQPPARTTLVLPAAAE